jgi:6-phosphogluconolactonase
MSEAQTGAPGAPSVRVYADLASLSAGAADVCVEAARAAIAAHGRFSVALSGGSTPRSLYQLLAAPPYREQVDWAHTVVCWGDERCVPPDHSESNYRMAREALLFHVPVPASQVFRMPGEAADPDTGAAQYEQALRRAFALGPAELPRFDLILLGLGPDGHTASLFPHTPALHVSDRLVVANPVEKLNTTRLTLTAPVLNNAARVVFLVAGADKAAPLAAVLEGPRRPDDLPAQLIAPTHGELLWLVDRVAAGDLRTAPRA